VSAFGQPLTTLVRQAQAVLEAHAGAHASAPAVLWQAHGESAADFGKRVELACTRLQGRRLLAVCGPRDDTPPAGVTWVQLPPRLLSLLNPRVRARYRVAYGGRGSGKSWAFARALIVRALERPTRVLCAREIQGSITESVHRLLSDQVDQLGLAPWFDVQATTIAGHAGSEFIFSGVRNNVSKLKSTEGCDLAWIEEAEKVSEYSWSVITPTIRKAASEIWASFNPDQEDDPTYVRFIKNSPPGALVEHVSWRDNPWFPVELAAEREYMARVDPDAHAWIWEGNCRLQTDAQIFRGKYVIEAFESAPTVTASSATLIFPSACGFFCDSLGNTYRRNDAAGHITVDLAAVPELLRAGFTQPSAQADLPKGWDGPYLGADWGFSQDPTALILCWIHARTLYLEHEAWAIGCDIDKTPALFDTVPGARRYTIRADCARPETISYMQQHGYERVTGVEKWKGSVEDGIAFIRSFERVVIHPRCTHAAQEFRLYSYKVDRLSGDVLPDVDGKNDHLIDALRYALQPMIRNPNTGFLVYMAQEVARMNARKAGEAAGAQ